MAPRHGKEFRTEAIRLALTSGLTRQQVAEDLGIGFSTLNRWVQKDQDDALMSGPHTDLETENNAVVERRLFSRTNGVHRLHLQNAQGGADLAQYMDNTQADRNGPVRIHLWVLQSSTQAFYARRQKPPRI